MRDFFLSLAVQFTSYFVLTLNFRAISAGLIPHAMVTDMMAAALSYFIIRRVSKSEGLSTLFGMMIGGAMAAACGIWLTSHWG